MQAFHVRHVTLKNKIKSKLLGWPILLQAKDLLKNTVLTEILKYYKPE